MGDRRKLNSTPPMLQKTQTDTNESLQEKRTSSEKNRISMNDLNIKDENDNVWLKEPLASEIKNGWNKGNQIGQGGFASVYLINSIGGSPTTYAVKEFFLNPKTREKKLDKFRMEAKICIKIGDHDRIVPFYGYSILVQVAQIFMAYMPKGSLDYNIPISSEEKCFHFIQQILEGLKYLHDQCIIHRDIKGQNILMQNENNIRISDFGVSKIVCEKPNTMEVGSWRWMAPEVCNKEINNSSYSFKADIWSVGCTVIEMLTGDHPYNSIKEAHCVIPFISDGIPPDIPENASDEMRRFLKATFAIIPAERKSATELITSFFSKKEDPVPEVIGIVSNSLIIPEMLETHTSLSKTECTKNPSHLNFISISNISKDQIPNECKEDNVYELIKIVADLTVKVEVKITSSRRPQFWPNFEVKYPYFDKGNSTEIRSGSGFIYNVTINSNAVHKCPCPKCWNSKNPSISWGKLELMTATHVVFDDIEANHTVCRLFFDNDESKEIFLDQFIILNANVSKNWSLMQCVTCNSSLLQTINEKIGSFHTLKSVIKSSSINEKFGFIVSHPHGGPKHVTFGELVDKTIIDDTWSQLTYTIATCQGTSGAYVHILGISSEVWHYPHVHSGSTSHGLNYSSVGFQGTGQVKSLFIKPPVLIMQEESDSDVIIDKMLISKEFRKKSIIQSDDFCTITEIQTEFPKDVRIVVKETRYRNSDHLYAMKDAYDNEFSLFKKLKENKGLLLYYGFRQTEINISKFIGYMPLGSLEDDYLKNGPIIESRCLSYVKQILKGLKYLNANGIIHMSIKCENIFLDMDDQIKIGRLEHSKVGVQKSETIQPVYARWTAPEIINPDIGLQMHQVKGRVDVTADIWSLGCTVVEMITAAVPYEYFTCTPSVILKISKGSPPEARTAVPKKIEDFLSLVFSIQQRPNSSQLLRDFSQIFEVSCEGTDISTIKTSIPDSKLPSAPRIKLDSVIQANVWKQDKVTFLNVPLMDKHGTNLTVEEVKHLLLEYDQEPMDLQVTDLTVERINYQLLEKWQNYELAFKNKVDGNIINVDQRTKITEYIDYLTVNDYTIILVEKSPQS